MPATSRAKPTETFTVTLSDPQGGATVATATATGTIVNDDFPPAENVFISEFHYDTDTGSSPDVGEFIEVTGVTGTDLTGWSLWLYNGTNGSPYPPTGASSPRIALSGVIADEGKGFGFVSVAVPGLQNGSPDAIALVDNFGRVVQFISYEGTLTAVSGPASGMTSTDIGVFEAAAPVGTSLQLAGTGSSYADFTWTFGEASTRGDANAGQSFLSGTDTGQVRIDDARVVEGTGGTSALTFTVHRAGGFATAASVDYAIAFDNADASDLVAGTPLAGTVTFAAGEYSRTITVAGCHRLAR